MSINPKIKELGDMVIKILNGESDGNIIDIIKFIKEQDMSDIDREEFDKYVNDNKNKG